MAYDLPGSRVRQIARYQRKLVQGCLKILHNLGCQQGQEINQSLRRMSTDCALFSNSVIKMA